jgi:hypothetical protein
VPSIMSLSYLLPYGAKPFLRSCQFTGTQELPSTLWNPTDHYRCSQEPSNGPYPEPDRSSPHHPLYVTTLYGALTSARFV